MHIRNINHFLFAKMLKFCQTAAKLTELKNVFQTEISSALGTAPVLDFK